MVFKSESFGGITKWVSVDRIEDKSKDRAPCIRMLGRREDSKKDWEGVAGEVGGKPGQCGILEMNRESVVSNASARSSMVETENGWLAASYLSPRARVKAFAVLETEGKVAALSPFP